jgi:hypothetical protein
VCVVAFNHSEKGDILTKELLVHKTGRGKKTNLLSHHHQGFGIVTRGLPRLWRGF